jgi:hypothetical protein
MKENSIRRAVREGRAALGTGLKEFATRGVPRIIEEYWKLGCKVLNLPGTDTSTYLEGLKARADRARARLKSIGVPVP